MKIAIDLRSLSSGTVSGVENYTLNIVESLLALDKKNEYILFYNAFDKSLPEELHFLNSRVVNGRIPNKVLNLQFKLNLWQVEKFTGRIDWFFMPNLNQFSLRPKTKLAITVHDLSPVLAPEFYDAKRRLWHWFLNYQKSFQKADLLFAVSEYTKSDLIRLFKLPENKIKVIYPGVDSKIYRPEISEEILRRTRNSYKLPGKYLLFLNTIEPRKNLLNLISAFELIDDPECYLLIGGRPGWKHGRIFNKIKGSKKRKMIKYLTYLPEPDKPAIIKLSQALVYPSFYEGFGFQPLEAMAMNVPAVVTQVTALPEVVGDAALLVNPYNISDLAHALMQVLDNQPLRSILTRKGLDRVKKFSWQAAAQTLLGFLDQW